MRHAGGPCARPSLIAFEPSDRGAGAEPRRAVFLDRDGVLIVNRDGDYVRSTADIEMIPNSARAVRRWTSAGFRVVVVSNQAAVAKGVMTARAAAEVHGEVVRRFAAEGAELWAGYLCPHGPDDGCPCRKPRPGMIHYAATRLDIDLSRSYLIGDALTDLAGADAAGVESHLVLTGRGSAQARLPNAAGLAADRIHDDLLAATRSLLAHYDGCTNPAARCRTPTQRDAGRPLANTPARHDSNTEFPCEC
jgi:D-glycero-D-manno-heptose 1,7-bisphosphate phosphatase